MKEEEKSTSAGLNQIVEIINAKGDIGELEEITGISIHKDKKKTEDKNSYV